MDPIRQIPKYGTIRTCCSTYCYLGWIRTAIKSPICAVWYCEIVDYNLYHGTLTKSCNVQYIIIVLTYRDLHESRV